MKLDRYRIEMSCNSTNGKVNNYPKTHFSWHCIKNFKELMKYCYSTN